MTQVTTRTAQSVRVAFYENYAPITGLHFKISTSGVIHDYDPRMSVDWALQRISGLVTLLALFQLDPADRMRGGSTPGFPERLDLNLAQTDNERQIIAEANKARAQAWLAHAERTYEVRRIFYNSPLEIVLWIGSISTATTTLIANWSRLTATLSKHKTTRAQERTKRMKEETAQLRELQVQRELLYSEASGAIDRQIRKLYPHIGDSTPNQAMPSLGPIERQAVETLARIAEIEIEEA